MNLQLDDKAKLKLLLTEMRARGMSIPKLEEDKKHEWKLSPNGYFIRRDGKIYTPKENQRQFIASTARFVGFSGGRGSGKALDISTPICTIDGWKTMGEIQVGDVVFDESGLPTEVISISETMYDHSCYKVIFSDDSEIVADKEHLWVTLDAKARKSLGRRGKKRGDGRCSHLPQCQPKYGPEIRTTFELLNSLTYGKRGDLNHSIDVAKPLTCSEVDLPIPPYVLGAWLGDGSSSCSQITIGECSNEIVNELRADGMIVNMLNYSSIQYRVDFVEDSQPKGENGQFCSNPDSYYSKLRELNLINNKHIPQIYLRAGYEQRFALLQGLMDTDGHNAGNGRCEFCVTNKDLADGFYELLISLGYKVSMKEGIAKCNGKDFIRYRFSFVSHEPVFRISYKAEKITPEGKQYKRTKRRYIKDIVPVESVPVKCITVNSPSHLYLAGKSMIPTHNSAAGAQKAMFKIMQGQSGAVLNPDFTNFKDSTWPEFKEWIPWSMVVKKHQHRQEEDWEPHKPFTLVFVNGVKVICKGLRDPDQARGPNINWLWYDEPTRDIDGLGWKLAIASVRVGIDPQAWATGTPRGRDNWFYRLFGKKEIPEEALRAFADSGIDREMVELFEGSIDENKDNLDPGFYASMLAAYPPGWLRKQELEGKFVDQGGILGNPIWFKDKRLARIPDDVTIKAIVRYWDLAASEKKLGKNSDDPDETVGTLMAWDGEFFYIIDQIKGYWEYKKLKEVIIQTAHIDGQIVPIYVEQEPGAGGKNQVADIASLEELVGYSVRPHRPEGDKVLRANIWFGEAASGKIYIIDGPWVDGFMDQLSSFPLARHDDRIDSVSGARLCVAPIRQWRTNISFLSI